MASVWQSDYLEKFLTFQRGFDITKKQVSEGPYKVISSSGPSYSHSEYKVEGPGVVIGRKGTLGSVFFSKENYWPHDTTLWIKDFHGNDPKCAYYFIKTMGFEQYDCGASNPTLNRNHIHKLTVKYPPLKEQRKIASVLSEYDNLIENNNRRIAILEEMTQSLYREWFVKFRFPGHEKTKFIVSPLGKIPEGWEVVSLSKLMDIQGGSQPPKKEWSEEEKEGYIRMLQIRDYQKDSYVAYVKDSNRLRKTTRDETLIARYGASVARILYGLEGAYNVAIAKVIEKKEKTREFLRWYLKDDYFQKTLIGMSGRAAQNGFNKGDIKAIRVIYPKEETIVYSFNDFAEPIYRQILQHKDQNNNLVKQRDLLLPKLISGKINLEF